MSNAVERARKALLGYDRWWNDGGSTSNRPEHADWAAIVRDLLAGMPGTLTEEERETVESVREQKNRGTGIPVVSNRLLAIIDNHFWPPAPAIKPGTRVRWWRDRNEECPHAEEGSGTYEKANPSRGWYPHSVSVSNCIRDFGVDRVEPLRTDGGTE